jgi:oxygen-independent coproporphyrinogen-3 oxidase
VTLEDGTIVRTVRVRHPAPYTDAGSAQARVAERRTVAAADLPFEYCLNSLRLREGFDGAGFAARTGLPIEAIEGSLADAVHRGLLVRSDERWLPTPLGRRFLNDLQALFLPG